ncbi:MAG: fumarylacetoacetate hydrolase family protein [Tetrasphaera sp.]
MKWVTFDGGSGIRTGILDGESVRGLAAGVTLLGLIEAGVDVLAEAGEHAQRSPDQVSALADIRVHAPIPRPPTVRDGLCFLDHLRGCYRALGRDTSLHPAWSQTPAFYFTNPDSIIGPDDDVPIAPGCRLFDLELELGAVIGRPGRDLHPDQAEEHIVGYTLFNDWTARDHQMRDLAQGIGLGKSKDSATTLGPVLVTADEFAAHRVDGRLAIELSATINDTEITRGRTDAMDWSFGELLAYISRGVDLTPGAVIGSGTVPGGCLLEHVDTPNPADYSGWLRPGDVVSLRADGIGATRQTVVAGVEVIPLRSGC